MRTSKKIWVLVTVLALLAISGVGQLLAASTTKSLSTNFTLVNFGTSVANVAVSYFTTGGGAWQADAGNTSFTIPANGGQKAVYSYFDTTMSPGQGSAVVSSDQPLGGVVQILARGQTPTSGAYSAIDPASLFYAPLVLRQQNTSSGLANTQFAIQNTGSSGLSGVTVAFVTSAGATAYTYNVPGSIPAGATHYYDAADDNNLPAPFAGSAIINAGSGSISVVVNVFFGTDGLQTYTAIPSTGLSNSWAIPLFNSRLANGLSTVVSVQNLSGGTAAAGTVHMDCTSFAGSAGPATLNLSNPNALANGQSYSFNPVTDLTIPAQWFGACRVTAPGNTAAIIQMRFIGTQNSAAYEAISTSVSGQTFFTPLVQKRLGNGFATNTTIVNLSNSAPANVTVTYTPSSDYVTGGGSAAVLSFTTQIPAGSSLQQNHRLSAFTAGPNAMPDGWYGTLRVVSSDQPIAGFTQITNVNNLPGDTFMTYTAFTRP
jgi:hypothetical protein